MKVINSGVIPKNGGVLLVGNHSSWFDTLFLTSVMKRPLWFVTGDFILNVPIMGSFVRHLCVIPLTKNNGKEGIERTVQKLKEGNLVCIFPEGKLTQNGELQRFRNGVAVIQKLSEVPIIPFYLDGAFKIWGAKQKLPKFFKKVSLKFGEPFYPQIEKDSDMANEIRLKVKELI